MISRRFRVGNKFATIYTRKVKIMKGFYCKCGKFVPYGTLVTDQIKHMESRSHKMGLKKRGKT